MARKKADNKFLTLEEVALFRDKLIKRKGLKNYISFVASVMGTGYATISTKFKKNRVEIAIRENVERVFENENLAIENSELKGRLEKIQENLTGDKK